MYIYVCTSTCTSPRRVSTASAGSKGREAIAACKDHYYLTRKLLLSTLLWQQQGHAAPEISPQTAPGGSYHTLQAMISSTTSVLRYRPLKFWVLSNAFIDVESHTSLTHVRASHTSIDIDVHIHSSAGICHSILFWNMLKIRSPQKRARLNCTIAIYYFLYTDVG